MKKYKFTLVLIFIAIGFSSCEKVLEIDLKEADPVLVVEANITDINELQTIYLTKTVPFNASNDPNKVSGAKVTVTENNTTVYTFLEVEPGKYSVTFRGRVGSTYDLEIELEGKTYTATSVMPNKVVLDSVSISKVKFFNEERKLVKVHFQDPAAEENAYRYIVQVNNVKVNRFLVDNDRFNNGQYIDRLINFDEPEIQTGDNITLDFQTIDLVNYRYFYSLSQILGGGGPPVAPSNPNSNISNGAQGYFSAHTSQRRMFVVNN